HSTLSQLFRLHFLPECLASCSPLTVQEYCTSVDYWVEITTQLYGCEPTLAELEPPEPRPGRPPDRRATQIIKDFREQLTRTQYRRGPLGKLVPFSPSTICKHLRNIRAI